MKLRSCSSIIALFLLALLSLPALAQDTPPTKDIFYPVRITYDVGTFDTLISLRTISSVWPGNWNAIDDDGMLIGLPGTQAASVIAELKTITSVFCTEKSSNNFCLVLHKIKSLLPGYPGGDPGSTTFGGDRGTVIMKSGQAWFLFREDYNRLVQTLKETGRAFAETNQSQ